MGAVAPLLNLTNSGSGSDAINKVAVAHLWQYAKLARYAKLSVYKHNRVRSGSRHSGSVYSTSRCKTCAGTILPSFEHNWLKWSYDKYDTQIDHWLGFQSLWLEFRIRAYNKDLGSSFRFRVQGLE